MLETVYDIEFRKYLRKQGTDMEPEEVNAFLVVVGRKNYCCFCRSQLLKTVIQPLGTFTLEGVGLEWLAQSLFPPSRRQTDIQT